MTVSDDALSSASETHPQRIETDYQIGQDNIDAQFGPFKFDVHHPTFPISSLAIIAFVIITLMFQDTLGPLYNHLKGWLSAHLDWFFTSAVNIMLLFCIVLILSPLGKIRLGGVNAKPDYSYTGWLSMLFAAGMGIGLMFYGVSEPISHFNTAMAAPGSELSSGAPLAGAPGDAQAAERLAMAATNLHWALHPWAIYAVVGLALALLSYNKCLPLSMRSIFYPIFGERIWGWPGHAIDILAVFATLFGLATSLGFGAEQANAGLNYLFGIPQTNTSKVILISAITGCALLSVVAGLDSGIKRLSEFNMALAALMLLFVVIVGPTTLILTGFFSNLWAYAENLIPLSMPFGRTDTQFTQEWSATYWAWWISWSPFVGLFIARVSRGRTVREFLVCVLLVPSLLCIFWMTALGGTAIDQIVTDGYQAVVEAPLELKLFKMLAALPLTAITSFVGIVLVLVFFVTSSDSGSLVIDTITAGGKLEAPVLQRIFWCIFEGLAAIALLLGGGLGALQAMAISTGFPFAIVLLLACYAVLRSLLSEPKQQTTAAPQSA